MNPPILNRNTARTGTRVWNQIEVTGKHKKRLGDHDLIQNIVRLEDIVTNFQALAAEPEFDGVLIDKDHLSHDTRHTTEAMGWLYEVEIRNGQLWGLMEWTDLGVQAIRNKRFKYFSTEYDPSCLDEMEGDEFQPDQLTGLALTNRPNNKGLPSISNRDLKKYEGAEKPKKKNKPMKSIAEKLGLEEGASEEEILAALDTVLAENEKLSADAEDVAVEEVLNRHSTRIAPGTRDDWKANLIANRESTEQLLAKQPEIKEAAPERKTLTNRKTARVPNVDLDKKNDSTTPADQAKAAAIRNRAHEITRKEGVSFHNAFSRAKAELGG